MRLQYRRKQDQFVVAVQLSLDTPGFTYRKWDGEQRCKAGDWLVDNQGDVYTVEQTVFERTYRNIGPGHYSKVTPVWAEVAPAAGAVTTLEGITHYAGGDYLIADDAVGPVKYAVAAAKFEDTYERVP